MCTYHSIGLKSDQSRSEITKSLIHCQHIEDPLQARFLLIQKETLSYNDTAPAEIFWGKWKFPKGIVRVYQNALNYF